ncbi:MAG: GyrI-like domain-containing protein [Nannocystaceae bacterium]|nr:GyrI-like domain-containing protein [Nannocystaceae bacterium]
MGDADGLGPQTRHVWAQHTDAVATHEGAYADLGKTYGAIFGQWIPDNGYRAADPPTLERYLNHPGVTPEADLRTEVWVRVERG